MQQEPAKKLFAGKSHHAFLAVIGIVLPTEADLGFGDRGNPVVGDSDAMGITSQDCRTWSGPPKGGFEYTIQSC